MEGAKPLPLSVVDLLERVVVGGWPETIDLTESDALAWMVDYLRNVAEVDVPALGPRRNLGIDARTLANYLDSLDRLMLLEPLPPWVSHLRSRTRLRTWSFRTVAGHPWR